MTDTPLDDIARLRSRLADFAAEHGLKLTSAQPIVGSVGGPHAFEAIFELDNDFDDADKETRDAFDAMMREQALLDRQQAAQKAAQAAESLSTKLDIPTDHKKGIFDE